MACLFCRIARKETDTEIIAEVSEAVAFRDIQPKAPIHILIVPRRHLSSLADTTARDRELLGTLLDFSREVAASLGLQDRGYKVAINVGRGGGQVIEHLHLHLLGGWQQGPGTLDV
ncbi:MAG: histidine triad nucleotide-binding protein [Candidatus Terrybacteria bacterium RIFCSPLOWO2_01_FULL_58_14]|uniref:Histidine triad nucleotide-binding protein n=2 Tax=Candidatus Terryibacteriota TaxID=1817920 RepID=A0A1G2Q0E6_9BACT|nr:MAG: histidine triad nucleotide-binding protein [Candidatus Terrybacteria bacterium RIFCSPHIGHO2_01_FULL_58_15]OHA53322.1 MAG: histidine triad nucleotide-binding protein [Candidatus Terrybacteria bacterium RIFCSPLOWO2_01_FULL_58_14]